MINKVNPGAIVPFYQEGSWPMEHTKHVTGHGDGWKILASNRRLIPFIFWEDAAPQTVDAFQAVDLSSGKIYDIATSKIIRWKRSDDSRTWYFFRDADLGVVLPCGNYKVRIELTVGAYISDDLEVVDFRGPESQSFGVTSCAADVITLTATDTLVDTINVVKAEYRITNASTWTTMINTAVPPAYAYDIDMGAISLPAGENLIIRRVIQTSVGNVLHSLWALDWDSGDPCGTYSFFQIDDISSYLEPDVWALEISDSEKWEDKIYATGFTERAYLRAHWATPESEREIETLISNTGARILSTADTREFFTLELERIPDQFIYPLAALPDYETIYLKSQAKDYEIGPLVRGEVEFITEPGSGRYYSGGRIRWRNNRHFERQCNETETTQAV